MFRHQPSRILEHSMMITYNGKIVEAEIKFIITIPTKTIGYNTTILRVSIDGVDVILNDYDMQSLDDHLPRCMEALAA